jgi:hypothetical protein
MPSSSSKASQEFVPLKEIRDGIVLLKTGPICAILMASASNFALKSTGEQEAILMQYKNFLNSLDFPIQFFIESRKFDIEPYLQLLKESLDKQTNELLAIQTREYMDFIKNLVSGKNIVSKYFYIVVPYTMPMVSASGGGGIFGFFGKKNTAKTVDDNFTQSLTQLEQRIIIIQSGLSSAGIRTVQLNTEEIIELFYKLFNPGKIGSVEIATS